MKFENQIARSLQALAFWHGYQRIRFPGLALREIAIAHELAALIFGELRGKANIKLEKSFKDLFEKNLIKEAFLLEKKLISKKILDLY